MQGTWEEQDVLLPLAAGFRRRLFVDAEIQVIGRVLAFEEAVPAIQEVDAVLDAKERTTRTPPLLIGTRSTHKLGGSGFLQLFTCSLADAVAQAGVTLATARRVRRVVPAGNVVGCEASAGVVARSFRQRPAREGRDEKGDQPATNGISHSGSTGSTCAFGSKGQSKKSRRHDGSARGWAHFARPLLYKRIISLFSFSGPAEWHYVFTITSRVVCVHPECRASAGLSAALSASLPKQAGTASQPQF